MNNLKLIKFKGIRHIRMKRTIKRGMCTLYNIILDGLKIKTEKNETNGLTEMGTLTYHDYYHTGISYRCLNHPTSFLCLLEEKGFQDTRKRRNMKNADKP